MEITFSLNVHSFMGVPIYSKDGEMLATLCAMDTQPYVFTEEDITVFKTMAVFLAYMMELELNKAKSIHYAERINQQNQLILDSVVEGIFGLDLEGKTTFINKAAAKLIGYEIEEVLGKNQHSVIHHTKSDGTYYPSEQCPILTTMKTGLTHQVSSEVFWRKDGTCFPVEYTNKPIYEAGDIVGSVVTFKDITERKKTEEILQYSEKLSVAGQLAAGIAHEIRNPLTAIKGFLQMMQNGFGENGEYYAILSSELQRIEVILDELLVLAKPQAHLFERRDLKPIVRHVVTLLGAQAIMKNIEIIPDFDPTEITIQCDENQLKQAFINFVKNAIEAMDHGGVIRVKVTAKKDRVIVRVTDQGRGIPEDRLKKIGEPFYTTKEKGTGLGMMMSYRIIENHRGQIHIESTVDEGTTVEVSFPL